jgi:ABC-type Fe3+/spermidine/putrescine transport system ATPase subunit
MTVTVDLVQLTKTYQNTTEPSVDAIDLSIDKGQLVAMLGPSGCGKTTTMKMVAGLLDPTSGDVRFDGRSVIDIPAEKRRVAMVFQKPLLFPHMSIGDNVAFGLRMRGVDKKTRRARVAEMMELVRLPGMEDRRPGQLSGGQEQRISLARGLITEPDILLLDEPLSQLDANLRIEMRDLIRHIQAELGITSIFVTHDQEEAVMLADRIALMMEGELLQFDAPREFYERPRTQAVARFFRNENFIEGRKRGCVVETTHGQILAPRCANLADGEVLLTVRPEHAKLVCDARPNSVAAIVTAANYMGTYTRVETLVGNRPWIVNAPPDQQFSVGACVNLLLPQTSVWLCNS